MQGAYSPTICLVEQPKKVELSDKKQHIQIIPNGATERVRKAPYTSGSIRKLAYVEGRVMKRGYIEGSAREAVYFPDNSEYNAASQAKAKRGSISPKNA